MKVCMLAKHHSFLDARIFQKEAKSLLKQGYDVTLVVPKKNGYLYDIDGTLFTDGRFQLPSFTYQGIKIVPYDDKRERLPKMLSNVKSNDYTSFDDPLMNAAIQENADIYHAHEFLSLYSAVGVKRTMQHKGKNVKLIYDSHDMTPDPLEQKKIEHQQLIHQILRHCLNEVDYIITVSPSIKSWYFELQPHIPSELIYNSPYLSAEYEPKTYSPNEPLTVCYEGLVHPTKGNKDIIVGILEETTPLALQFMIIGGEREGKPISVPAHLKTRFIQKGWVPHHTIPQHMKQAHIGWIDFDVRYSLNKAYALPNKFFSYLNNGLPVLVNRCNDMADFIRTHRCGLVIDKLQPTASDYANAIHYLNERKDLLQKMSNRARKVMENYYSWERMEKRLYRVYHRLANAGSPYLLA